MERVIMISWTGILVIGPTKIGITEPAGPGLALGGQRQPHGLQKNHPGSPGGIFQPGDPAPDRSIGNRAHRQ